MTCTAKPRARRARGHADPVSKSAPHFPDVDPKNVVRLRDYQVEKHDEVQAHLARGARVVPLVLPTGAGKTTICKAIASGWDGGGPDRLVIVLGPTRAVVRQFQEPGPYIYNGRERLDWRGADDPRAGLPQPTPAQLVDLAWLTSARGVWISTRQSWGHGAALKRLAEAPADPGALRHLLVIADEAHHHHPGSWAGKLIAELERRGATIIPVTATPYYEDGPLFDPEVDARTVRLTAVDFAQMTDERGRPYCPRDWDFTRHFVGASEDVADAYDGGGAAKGGRGKAAAVREVCRAMAEQWAADERPKGIFFLPERSWVGPMLRALVDAGADKRRVFDFTGDDLDDSALEALDRERKVKRYQDSEIDAILSCARFDEGTDWPLAAVGYCWRIPDSVVRVLQRLGRCSRGKARIEGYPARWADVQTMRFFVRQMTGEGADKAWERHGRMALVLALFLGDYREALRWARTVGTERAPREPREPAEPRPPQARETDPLVLAQARLFAAECARRPGATVGGVIDKLRKAHPTLSATQAKAIAARIVRPRKLSADELAARRARVEAGVLGDQRAAERGQGWVREEMEAGFAAIMDEVLDEPADVDEGALREAALRFSAQDVEDFVSRFRAAGASAGFAWPETREGLIAFALEHGRRHFEREGKWPAARSGQIDGLGTTWESLNSTLHYRWKLSLREVFGRMTKEERSEKNARAIRAFYDRHGRWPLKTAKEAEERRLSVALGSLRRRRPDLLDRHGIPRKADLSAIIRAAHGKPQWASVADIVPCFCTQPAATQSTVAIGSDSGRVINELLRRAANPDKRSQSRGLGATPEALAVLCQVNSIARLQAEIRADCWRLWLQGQDEPDSRSWAEVRASGDNARVVKAERVAFLDWDNPTGPTARNWSDSPWHPSVAARRPWPGAQWPDLLAPAPCR